MLTVMEVYNRCGSCRHFEPMFTDRMDRTMGECRGKPTHPTVGAQEFGCPNYHLDRKKLVPGTQLPADADISPAERERLRRAALVQAGVTLDAVARRTPTVRRVREVDAEESLKLQEIPLSLADDATEQTMDRETLKSIMAEVLDEALGITDTAIHPRYKGGKVIVQPANPQLQAKEIEVEVLFRKVVAIRDKLRVLEQKINGSENLDSAEKIQIQQYITACYGTMTTFNFLFRDRDDGFAGQG